MARPSEQMKAILSGTMPPSEADESVQSWLRLPVYNMAVRVLSFGTKEARRVALLMVCGDEIRAMVEEKAKELWQK